MQVTYVYVMSEEFVWIKRELKIREDKDAIMCLGNTGYPDNNCF